MEVFMNKIKFTFGLFAILAVLIGGVAFISPANASSAPMAQVSFTFDDGFASTYYKAAPILASHGLTGTQYIATGCVDGLRICHNEVDPNADYITWNQVLELKNTYGWEIGAHTRRHHALTELSARRLSKELNQSTAAFAAHGLYPTAFASPFGDYDSNVLAAVAKQYQSQRGFFDTGYNTWPYNRYLLRVQQVQYGVSVDTVKSYIDKAATDGTWLILVFHDIKDNPSTDPEDFQFATADFETIAAYVQSLGLHGTKVTDGLYNSQPNLLPNSQFDNGLSDGWTTNNPSRVMADSSGHGSVSSPETSIKLTAGAGSGDIYLFSPVTAIDPTLVHSVTAYVNITKLTNEGVGVYVDEYNANHEWISGQYKQFIGNPIYKDISFAYNASSDSVAYVRVQFIVSNGSGVVAYVDNVRWQGAAGEVTPVPEPEPVPVPVQDNLLTNASFTDGLNGWRTDVPTDIALDTSGNGNPAEPANSVSFNAGNANSHLFSDLVDVDSTQTYQISAWVNLVSRNSGEVAIYVDEYDLSGNWISGKYLGGTSTLGTQTLNYSYTPSSSAVVSASYQFIVVGNSGISGWFDEPAWIKI